MIAQTASASPVIVNDVGNISISTIVNSLIILLLLGIVISLLYRYGKRTFQTLYTEPGQCGPDDNYEYKDPNIHSC